MGKRNTKPAPVDQPQSRLPVVVVSPAPKQQPVMLAISVVLFALWLAFLIATAVFGV